MLCRVKKMTYKGRPCKSIPVGAFGTVTGWTPDGLIYVKFDCGSHVWSCRYDYLVTPPSAGNVFRSRRRRIITTRETSSP